MTESAADIRQRIEATKATIAGLEKAIIELEAEERRARRHEAKV